MARISTGPKNHTVSCRLSEEQAELVEQLCARLGISRAAWLEDLVADALRWERPPVPGRHARLPDSCPHPRSRVIKGFCYACGKPS